LSYKNILQYINRPHGKAQGICKQGPCSVVQLGEHEKKRSN